ncbi:MAG: GIY-YIG nuclease family protein [Elusimicrobiaceae bacterium]|nr:GIY-YIG nuclease family protein [Elusimicrobiaceae bacterium]
MAYVYILTNQYNTTLYVGVTNDLVRRVYEHKQELIEGFTKRYKLHKLVYYEQTPSIVQAITREKELKKWNRSWKDKLINDFNPTWTDLYDLICS